MGVGLGYRLEESDDRITATDSNGVVIAGAYLKPNHSLWSVYVARPIAEFLDHEHPDAPPANLMATRDVIARQWVMLVAELYIGKLAS